jgi:Ran GTPase-activating protein (RanGAP) involved in mRNA processing and transport
MDTRSAREIAEEFRDLVLVVRNNIKSTTFVNLARKGKELTHDRLKELAEALTNNTVVTKLHLERNGIDADDIAPFAFAFTKNESVTQFDLRSNEIGDEGCESLANSLVENEKMCTLYLFDNKIGSGGAYGIGGMLEVNKALVTLDLRTNEIGDIGCEHIAKGLKVNKALKVLVLDNNKISDKGAKEIGKALRWQWDDDLPKSPKKGGHRDEGGGEGPVRRVNANRCLTALYLNNNQISDEGVKALAIGLRSNGSLANLYLRKNLISCTGANDIANMLRDNTALVALSLFSNQLKAHGAKQIANGLRENHTLMSLDLEGNKGIRVGVRQLGVSLNDCWLEKLELGGIGVTSADCKALRAGLEKNNTLTYLNLANNQIGEEGCQDQLAIVGVSVGDPWGMHLGATGPEDDENDREDSLALSFDDGDEDGGLDDMGHESDDDAGELGAGCKPDRDGMDWGTDDPTAIYDTMGVVDPHGHTHTGVGDLMMGLLGNTSLTVMVLDNNLVSPWWLARFEACFDLPMVGRAPIRKEWEQVAARRKRETEETHEMRDCETVQRGVESEQQRLAMIVEMRRAAVVPMQSVGRMYLAKFIVEDRRQTARRLARKRAKEAKAAAHKAKVMNEAAAKKEKARQLKEEHLRATKLIQRNARGYIARKRVTILRAERVEAAGEAAESEWQSKEEAHYEAEALKIAALNALPLEDFIKPDAKAWIVLDFTLELRWRNPTLLATAVAAATTTSPADNAITRRPSTLRPPRPPHVFVQLLRVRDDGASVPVWISPVTIGGKPGVGDGNEDAPFENHFEWLSFAWKTPDLLVRALEGPVKHHHEVQEQQPLLVLQVCSLTNGPTEFAPRGEAVDGPPHPITHLLTSSETAEGGMTGYFEVIGQRFMTLASLRTAAGRPVADAEAEAAAAARAKLIGRKKQEEAPAQEEGSEEDEEDKEVAAKPVPVPLDIVRSRHALTPYVGAVPPRPVPPHRPQPQEDTATWSGLLSVGTIEVTSLAQHGWIDPKLVQDAFDAAEQTGEGGTGKLRRESQQISLAIMQEHPAFAGKQAVEAAAKAAEIADPAQVREQQQGHTKYIDGLKSLEKEKRREEKLVARRISEVAALAAAVGGYNFDQFSISMSRSEDMEEDMAAHLTETFGSQENEKYAKIEHAFKQSDVDDSGSITIEEALDVTMREKQVSLVLLYTIHYTLY